MTIGDIEDKLNRQIFEDDEPSRYIEREILLKKFINVVFSHCIQLVSLPDEVNVSYYKDIRVKRSLKRYSDYIDYLAEELEREKIINFFSKQQLFFANYDIDIPFIVANSYYGSIKYDLYWITDLKLYDALDISVGNKNVDELASYLPTTFKNFKSDIHNYFKSEEFFKEFKDTFQEIEKAYKVKLFRACSLLILTSIEGIVRKLGHFLIEKRDLKIKSKDYANSLDGFLRKVEWEKDYPVSYSKYRLITGDCDFCKGNEPNEIMITFQERLDFLRRRFKEDRDLILHGLENDYGKEWHLFINFKALEEVYKTSKFYIELYKEK